ncbi:hypothetical protein WICPIJ_005401 [Wickerhamomyces pijperi]|uniref:Uncharacterized protein n=1 Tax=Wickerhamomyces pijperi TaxID=599730 RepID=A0A9P8Q673_WICPI|nr:hypothetical protein WICPIJ_005401 [Wickerhamomyces pijperi]
MTVEEEIDDKSFTRVANHKHANSKQSEKRLRCECKFVGDGKELKEHLSQNKKHIKISHQFKGKWLYANCVSCGRGYTRDLVVLKSIAEVNILLCAKCTKKQLKANKKSFMSIVPFQADAFFDRLHLYFKLDYMSPDTYRKTRLLKLVEGIRHKPSYTDKTELFQEMAMIAQVEQSMNSKPLALTKVLTWEQSGELTIKVDWKCKQLRGLGAAPFREGGYMFILKPTPNVELPDVWLASITGVHTEKLGKPRTKLSDPPQKILYYEVSLKIVSEWYKNQPVNESELRFMLCDIGDSRSFDAMRRLEDDVILDMVVGSKPSNDTALVPEALITWNQHTLNSSQKEGIRHLLAPENTVTMLQGPPGTGKTSTILEAVLQLIDTPYCKDNNCILIVAQSNVAIDNIAEKLLKYKVPCIVRVASGSKESEYDALHTLGDITLHNMVYRAASPSYVSTDKRLKSGKRKYVLPYELGKYYSERYERSCKILKKRVNVILTTTVGSGSKLVVGNEDLNISVVIMDEATQSNQGASLIPLSAPGLKKVMLVGDDKQLSSFAEIPYREFSLFERLLHFDLVVNPLLLDTQYRMHPKISEFPIKHFYQKKLKNGISEKDRPLNVVGLRNALSFFCTGTECPESKVGQLNLKSGAVNDTYINKKEAKYVVMIMKYLLLKNKHLKPSQFPVITPYAAQRDLIARIIAKDKFLNPKEEAIQEENDNEMEDTFVNAGSAETEELLMKTPSVLTVNGIMIASIDAYQGREEDFIIFSCVRSNKFGNVGFIKDKRRLNVALTRARFGLIMVGSKPSLQNKDPLWALLMEHFELEGHVIKDIPGYLGVNGQATATVENNNNNSLIEIIDDGLGDLMKDLELFNLSDSDEDEEEDEIYQSASED